MNSKNSAALPETDRLFNNWQKKFHSALKSLHVAVATGKDFTEPCSLLTDLLKEGAADDSIKKDISKNKLSQLFDLLLSVEEKNVSVIKCFTTSICYHTRATSRFLNNLQNYLWTAFLSTNDDDIRLHASLCLAHLPKLRICLETNVSDISPAESCEAWHAQFISLMTVAHGCAKNLSSQCNHQSGQSEAELKAVEFLGLTGDSFNVESGASLLTACLCVARCMLKMENSAAVVVPVSELVDAVSPVCSLKLVTQVDPISLFRAILRLFSAVLETSARTGLLLVKHKVMHDVLVPIHQFATERHHSIVETEELAGLLDVAFLKSEWYSVMTSLVIQFGIAWTERFDEFQFILTELSSELQPAKNVAVPVEPKQSNKPKSSKNKRQRRNSDLLNSEQTARPKCDPVVDKALSLVIPAACRFITNFIYKCGHLVKSNIFQHLQLSVVRICLDVQQAAHDSYPVPYGSGRCRISLYKVLKALVVCPHPSVIPAVQCAVNLFSSGCNDSSFAIAEFCVEASAVCATITRPRLPCLENTYTSMQTSFTADAEEITAGLSPSVPATSANDPVSVVMSESADVLEPVANGYDHIVPAGDFEPLGETNDLLSRQPETTKTKTASIIETTLIDIASEENSRDSVEVEYEDITDKSSGMHVTSEAAFVGDLLIPSKPKAQLESIRLIANCVDDMLSDFVND